MHFFSIFAKMEQCEMKNKVYRAIIYFLVSFTILAGTGCSNLKELKNIRATSARVESFRISSLKTVDAVFDIAVDNPAKDITLSDINGTIEQNGEVIGNFSAAPLDIPGRTQSTIRVKGRVELAPGLSPIKIMSLVNNADLDSFTASVSLKAGIGKKAGKRFSFKRIPISGIIRNFKK